MSSNSLQDKPDSQTLDWAKNQLKTLVKVKGTIESERLFQVTQIFNQLVDSVFLNSDMPQLLLDELELDTERDIRQYPRIVEDMMRKIDLCARSGYNGEKLDWEVTQLSKTILERIELLANIPSMQEVLYGDDLGEDKVREFFPKKSYRFT